MAGVGTVLGGKYRLVRKLGEGGMGIVYEAEHMDLGKRLAVKLLQPTYASNRDILKRFQQEARAACRIGHPGIVDVSDIGMTPDREPYMVMELLHGESLAAALERHGSLPLDRAADILGQVLSALSAAHGAGIVHRDIKPDNVFLTHLGDRADFVKLLDFGISKFLAGSLAGAKLTQTGSVLGTPLYLAPEQARGDRDIDHRVDIYAVGVMAYQMLSGRVPYSADNYQQLLFRIVTEPPVPLEKVAPDLAEEVVDLIDRAMSKDRRERPRDALAFRRILLACADLAESTGPTSARVERRTAPVAVVSAPEVMPTRPSEPTPTLWTETLLRSQRRRVLQAAVAFAAVIAAAAIAMLLRRGLESESQPEAHVVPAAGVAAPAVPEPRIPPAAEEASAPVRVEEPGRKDAAVEDRGQPEPEKKPEKKPEPKKKRDRKAGYVKGKAGTKVMTDYEE